jgi:hypothetical protein
VDKRVDVVAADANVIAHDSLESKPEGFKHGYMMRSECVRLSEKAMKLQVVEGEFSNETEDS